MTQEIDEEYLRQIVALDGGWTQLLAMLTAALTERDLHQAIARAVVQRHGEAVPVPREGLDSAIALIQRLRSAAEGWQRDDALEAREPDDEAALLTEAADKLAHLAFRGHSLWKSA